jgi:hypothetical protein
VANVVVPTPEYVRFATHYGFRPDFCEAADPESKGMVERPGTPLLAHLVNASSAGLLDRQLSPDSFDPDHQLRVGPAAHAVDQLQQLQRRLQLLLAQLAESEPGSLTGEVDPPLVHVAVEREDQLTALLDVQAVDQTADSPPHRRGEIRHGELDHAANLAAAFTGKLAAGRGRRQCL